MVDINIDNIIMVPWKTYATLCNENKILDFVKSYKTIFATTSGYNATRLWFMTKWMRGVPLHAMTDSVLKFFQRFCQLLRKD